MIVVNLTHIRIRKLENVGCPEGKKDQPHSTTSLGIANKFTRERILVKMLNQKSRERDWPGSVATLEPNKGRLWDGLPVLLVDHRR